MSARPAFIIFVNSDASGGRLTLIWRRHSLVHAFVTSRVDYYNAILAAAPKTTTDRLRVLNAAARVVSDTKKFDQGISRLMHQQLHWLDISERVNIQAGSADPPVSARQDASVPPLHDILCDRTSTSSQHLRSAGILLSLVRRCLTLCQMIYEILQSAHRPFLCLSARFPH